MSGTFAMMLVSILLGAVADNIANLTYLGPFGHLTAKYRITSGYCVVALFSVVLPLFVLTR